MTDSAGVGSAASDGLAGDGARGVLSNRVIAGFVAVGIALSVASLTFTADNTRSFLFDILAVLAATGAVVGLWCNRPRRRRVWVGFTASLVLFVAGDVVFDLASRGVGQPDGYPYADACYLLAYTVL